MPNIPGLSGYSQPDVFSRVRTLQRALSIPGGLRILGVVGEGRREETIVESAQGGGLDGFDPTFTKASDGYGRFFRLANYPIISNRTTLLLNDATLRILEGTIDGTTFSSQYDAKLEIATGKIELQSASLKDQGGKLYSTSPSNIGDGYLSTPTLSDTNAPAEIWTIRCSSVLKDGYGVPIRGTATFIARGTVSGQILDGYGQPYIWKSDGIVVDNGILSFAIYNNPSPAQPFAVGDKFTIEVESKVLQSMDKLEAKYIATSDVNDPQTYTEPSKLFSSYGTPSTENTLSLGSQMAFENGSTSVLALQAKPPLPRRTSDIVLPAYNSITGTGGATGNSNADDLIFAIDAPGLPDSDAEVHLFVLNTDGTEDQIFPNKVTLYDPDITAAFSVYEETGVDTLLMAEFMDPGQSGFAYSYTVVSDDEIEQGASDGYITPIGLGATATFYSPSAIFKAEDLTNNKEIDIFQTSTANEGRWPIASIVDANTVTISRMAGSFVTESNLKWQLILPGSNSQRLLLTTDLALALRKGLRITYIDNKDAEFYDANWAEALDVLETQDVQILVPLPTQTFSAIQQAFRVHCERMSSTYYKRERILLTGAIQGLTTDNVLGTELAAVEDIGILEGIQGDDVEEVLDGNIEDLANYGVAYNFGDTYRVVYFYPDEIIRVINGSQTTLSGYYMAAAAGGWLAGEPNLAMPLTYKVLVGFTILNDKVYKQTVLDKLGDAGITVVQPVTGGGRVQHGKTTTQSGAPEEEEISIVAIRDHLARTMRRSFRAFIGQPSDPTLIPSLTQRAIKLLNAFVSQNLITDYRNLSVSRDDVEPRQYNIVVEVEPNYPTCWIFIDISVGLF
jgi:vacuolar-type H+-ATPase subunit F/Vma7